MNKYTRQDLPTETVSGRSARAVVVGAQAAVFRWDLAAHDIIPGSAGEGERILTVVKGWTAVMVDSEEFVLSAGDFCTTPPGASVGFRVGPEDCELLETVVPPPETLRTTTDRPAAPEPQSPASSDAAGWNEDEAYRRIRKILQGLGADVELERLKEHPLELLVHYAYEKQALSMGEIRNILALDKKQARDLIRTWKHGDDHSGYSAQRKLERLVILPGESAPRRMTS